jgi:hypothetical protein
MDVAPRKAAMSIVRAIIGSVLVASMLPGTVDGNDMKFSLTKDGKSDCTLVAITGHKPQLLITRALESIAGTIRRWAEVDLPIVTINDASGKLPAAAAIVLTTLDRLRMVAPEVETSTNAVKRVAFTDDHGFAIAAVESEGVTRMFVAGRTARGVFNGAVYPRDFLIDGANDNLYLRRESVVRSPQMNGRPVYILTIWANEAEYSVENWMTVFDSFARDGVDRLYFWLSGHFPSRKFPHTHRTADPVAGDIHDSTKESRFATLEDQRRIIHYAHEMGLRFYLGGALGGWSGTRMLTHHEPQTMKKTPIGEGNERYVDADGRSLISLCPSHPKVRQALVEYYKEMFDALPEADGLFLESADEAGECRCDMCSKPVDDLGSRQFGQAQLSLVQEIMRAIWQDHPHARVAYTIGYSPHTKDTAYYEVVRQMNDPRIEWMEARNSWEMPGPQGRPLPAPCFSRQMMSWKYHEKRRLDEVVEYINRLATEGWYGYIANWAPGFDSGSPYMDVPHPTHLLPYVLNYFVYREMTWEPALTLQQMRQRSQQRFFGEEAAERLGTDLWELREVMREASAGAWELSSGAWGYRGCKPLTPAAKALLQRMEENIKEARAKASPKTSEGLDLMTRAINDIRKHCK